MTINYQGTTTELNITPAALAEVPSNAKSSMVVHVQVTSLDAYFRRELNFWLSISGGRNNVIAAGVPVQYGETPEFSGISLNPGETLNGYADTNGLLVITTSVGVQQ
jgi:hypothetical protein